MSETRKIEFGRHYDLPFHSKIGLTGYYLLCAVLAPFLLGISGLMIALALSLVIALSPFMVLWMTVAEVWMPPLEEQDVQHSEPDECDLNPVDDGVGQDPEDDEDSSGTKQD